MSRVFLAFDESLGRRIVVDLGFINHPLLAIHDPMFASTRDYAPFKQLMERVRERWQAFEA